MSVLCDHLKEGSVFGDSCKERQGARAAECEAEFDSVCRLFNWDNMKPSMCEERRRKRMNVSTAGLSPVPPLSGVNEGCLL